MKVLLFRCFSINLAQKIEKLFGAVGRCVMRPIIRRSGYSGPRITGSSRASCNSWVRRSIWPGSVAALGLSAIQCLDFGVFFVKTDSTSALSGGFQVQANGHRKLSQQRSGSLLFLRFSAGVVSVKPLFPDLMHLQRLTRHIRPFNRTLQWVVPCAALLTVSFQE